MMVSAVMFANQCDFLFDTLIIYYAMYWLQVLIHMIFVDQ